MQTPPPPEETKGTEKPVWYPEQQDQEVVIAYTSKHLNEREAQWSTIEKECFAIVHAIEVFRTYLYGRKFVVFTDHRPLEWLLGKANTSGRLQRWALKIQEYDMKIGYRPGKSHQNADCLSRIPFIPFDPRVRSPFDPEAPPPSTIAAVLFTPNPEKAAKEIVRDGIHHKTVMELIKESLRRKTRSSTKTKHFPYR